MNRADQRLAYLKFVYHEAGGDPRKYVKLSAIQEALELSGSDLDALENVLFERRMIRNTNGKEGRKVCLTDNGIAEVEGAKEAEQSPMPSQRTDQRLTVQQLLQQPASAISTTPSSVNLPIPAERPASVTKADASATAGKPKPSGDQWYAVLGHVWESLGSMSHKLLFLAVLAAVCCLGYGMGVWRYDAKLDTQEAKHQQEIYKLQKQHDEHIAELRKQHAKPAISAASPEVGLPNLEDAPFDKMSIHEFGKAIETRRKPLAVGPLMGRSIFEREVGRRFEWEGLADEVIEGKPYLRVRLRMIPLKGSSEFSTYCYFHEDKYRNILENLSGPRMLLVTGVLNSEGNLTQCKLIEVRP